ncbi:hypothetical protein AALO_G00095130 [Alosa alosa]|uniref:Uncharacterized protein n=1 Tax=Alosa alosa TaxID=278164 RepID=A0AAV6GTA1_9TELE|nr:hypothetical protein AALO_G00095130 [Alosa alosa]
MFPAGQQPDPHPAPERSRPQPNRPTRRLDLRKEDLIRISSQRCSPSLGPFAHFQQEPLPRRFVIQVLTKPA